MAKKKISEALEEVLDEEVIDENELKENRMRLNKEELISTGCTQLDIALSNTTYGGILTGKYVHIVGNSTSGKTFVALNIVANIVNNPKYDEYDIFWDDIEGGNEIDIEEIFGPITASRLKAPRYSDDGEPIYSVTVEDMYDNVMKKFTNREKTGRKFFYFVDSMDGLTSEADIDKNEENMALRDRGKETTGSFGMSKASVNSKRLGITRNYCKKLDCTLFIISQDRDDCGFGKKAGAKTYSGGTALKFYSDIQLWFKHREAVEETIDGKKRCIGNRALIDITKNRLTGQKHKKIPLYISFVYGIDNVIPLIEYLIEEKVWDGKPVDTKGFCDTKKQIGALSNWIVDNDKEEDLIKLVQDRHMEIQEKIKGKYNRKRKYK